MDLEEKISDVSKTIFNFSKSKTGNISDAEDLSQAILLELCRSVGNLRDERAFYGFMWSVANNVYKRWYSRKCRSVRICELEDNTPDEDFDIMPEEDERIAPLRRELCLLSEKYRRAVILYYIENRSCSEISSLLGVSESMVKYLLFKSRKKLKEGIVMERIYGEKSYNPKSLKLLFWFWKGMSDRYFGIDDDKVAQNILFACYNDRLTAEQISLDIGVPLPYMEDTLEKLCGVDLLIKDRNKYLTNIVIFTDELKLELRAKTADISQKIADIVEASVSENEKKIRSVGFRGCDMSANSFAWQISSMILYKATVDDLDERVKFVHPKDRFGTECVVCGVENYQTDGYNSMFGVGISNSNNDRGDIIRFVDFPVNGAMLHHVAGDIRGSQNVMYDIARGATYFSENDKVIIAELVKKGLVRKDGDTFSVNAPIFTVEQFKAVEEILGDASSKVADEVVKMMSTVEGILKDHAPSHLQSVCSAVSYLRLLDDAISFSVEKLYGRGFLAPYNGTDILPTMFIVLK